MRHAEAAPGDPDELRPLTAEGKAAARAVAEKLAVHKPDAVVCSPLLRARETAELIARAAGIEADPEDKLGPGADVSDLSAAVSGRGDTVVVVGHQPDCSEIVMALTGEERDFAPAAYAELEL